MVQTSIILIGLAAALGIYMLYYLLAGLPVPKGMAFVHGPLALAGLIVLVVYAFTTSSHHKHYESISLFSVAAVAGVVLIYRDLTGKKLPKWLGLLHGILALAGIVMVLMHTLGGSGH